MQAEIHGAFAREAYLGSNEVRDLRTSELARLRDLERELRSVSSTVRPADIQRATDPGVGPQTQRRSGGHRKNPHAARCSPPGFYGQAGTIDAAVAEQIAALDPLTLALTDAFSAVGSTLESSVIRALDDAIATAKNFGDVMKQLALDLVKSFGQSLVQSAFKPVQDALGQLGKATRWHHGGRRALAWRAGSASSSGWCWRRGRRGAWHGGAANLSDIWALAGGRTPCCRAMRRRAACLLGPPSASLREGAPEAVVPLTPHGVATFTSGLLQSTSVLQSLAASLTKQQMAGFRPITAQDASSHMTQAQSTSQQGRTQPGRY